MDFGEALYLQKTQVSFKLVKQMPHIIYAMLLLSQRKILSRRKTQIPNNYCKLYSDMSYIS